MMSGSILTLTDMSLSLAYPTVENTDYIGNVFGANITLEPARMTSDNWTRNNVKTLKNQEYYKKESQNSTSKLRSQIKRKDSHNSSAQSTRQKPTGDGILSQFNTKVSNNIQNGKKEKLVLPEPVEIDNKVEEDNFTIERNRFFLDFEN